MHARNSSSSPSTLGPLRPSSLQQLSHSNLRRLADALPKLYAAATPTELPDRILDALGRLIPGAIHGCTIVDLTAGRRRHVRLSPTPVRADEAVATFSRFWHQFPLKAHRELTRSGDALAISDLISRQNFRRLDLFEHYYRPLGLEDDLSINVGDHRTKLCVCVLRERRGFQTQERLLLDALRPHVLLAQQNAALRAPLTPPPPARATPRLSAPVQWSAEALLRALPLTAREAEVLLWVAQGKTNPETALILGIQPYTVRTHLEHIFAKLGVETRHAAAVCAMEALRD
ncbi:MAG: helix-turn-helix transcriptional regulator [Verrucomicrobia bacterium]|nr:helix-turn-helix transcriptional regulator [Verrucomicrobiota bacterium]